MSIASDSDSVSVSSHLYPNKRFDLSVLHFPLPFQLPFFFRHLLDPPLLLGHCVCDWYSLPASSPDIPETDETTNQELIVEDFTLQDSMEELSLETHETTIPEVIDEIFTLQHSIEELSLNFYHHSQQVDVRCAVGKTVIGDIVVLNKDGKVSYFFINH